MRILSFHFSDPAPLARLSVRNLQAICVKLSIAHAISCLSFHLPHGQDLALLVAEQVWHLHEDLLPLDIVQSFPQISQVTLAVVGQGITAELDICVF